MLSGQEWYLVIGGEETGVAIFSDVRVGGFGVMGLLRASFGVSSTKAVLRRSMLTTSSLPFSRIVNVLLDRLSTLNGPSYGGCKGFLTRSHRRNT